MLRIFLIFGFLIIAFSEKFLIESRRYKCLMQGQQEAKIGINLRS